MDKISQLREAIKRDYEITSQSFLGILEREFTNPRVVGEVLDYLDCDNDKLALAINTDNRAIKVIVQSRLDGLSKNQTIINLLNHVEDVLLENEKVGRMEPTVELDWDQGKMVLIHKYASILGMEEIAKMAKVFQQL